MNLMGMYEAAETLGVTRQRVYELLKQGVLPEPIARLKCGPVWSAEGIIEYAATRNRKVGRPKRTD